MFSSGQADNAVSQLQLRLFLENSQDLIYIYRVCPTRGYEYVSPSCEPIFGYTPAEFYADPELLLKIIHPDDRAALEESISGLVKPAQPSIRRWIHREGRIVWTENVNWSIRDKTGRITALHGIGRDITERKRGEEALAHLAAIVQQSTHAIYRVNLDGIVEDWNHGAETLYGYSAAEMVGRSIAVIFDPDDKDELPKLLSMMARGQAIPDHDAVRVRKDGQRITTSVSWSPIWDGGTRILGASAIARDITERKMAERYNDALNEINELIHSTLDPEQVMRRVIERAAGVLESDTAAISVRGPDGWTVRYVHGFPQEVVGARMNDDEERHAMLAIRTLQPVAIDDAFDDERVNQAHMRKWNVRSVLIVPLRIGREAVGVMYYNYHQHPFHFLTPHIDFATRLGSSVALALDNARLYSDLEQELRQRRAIEAQLEERNRQLSYQAGVLSRIHDAVMATDEGWRITYWNRTAEDLLGWTPEEALGRYAGDLFQVEVPGRSVEAASRELYEKGFYEGEVRYRRRDGIYIDVHARSAALTEAGGRVVGVVTSARDITDRKRIERERVDLLRREQAARARAEENGERVSQLLALTTGLSTALTPHDIAEVILRQGLAALGAVAAGVNILTPSGEEVELIDYIGYPAELTEPFRRQPLDTPFPSVEAIRTGEPIWLESLAEIQERYPAIMPFQEAGGYGALAAIPCRSNDKTVGSVGIQFARDRAFTLADQQFMLALGEQCAQALERARLFEAEKTARAEAEAAVRLRDHFFNVASHELRNPLTTLIGYSDMLATGKGALSEERKQRAMQSIHQQALRLNRMIGALLDVSRIESGKLRLERAPFDLLPLVANVVEEARPMSKKHVLEVRAPAGPLIVDGDELRVEQVLLNLLQNAIKYSPKGGAVTVSADARDRQAVISVADCGMGIPADALPRLFKRFYRAANAEEGHIPGLGIGLYVVHEIVSLHGGSIEVESVEEKGTTFTVRLPLARPETEGD